VVNIFTLLLLAHQNNPHCWGCSVWENFTLFRWFDFEIGSYVACFAS